VRENSLAHVDPVFIRGALEEWCDGVVGDAWLNVSQNSLGGNGSSHDDITLFALRDRGSRLLLAHDGVGHGGDPAVDVDSHVAADGGCGECR